MKKQCKTCEFNFDGICAGHGDEYEYGAKIIDDTKCCDDWGADFEYFNYSMKSAPRFLREQYNDCHISYDEFTTKLNDLEVGNSVSINLFDAIKYIYGISMVDIAVLIDETFGVVYSEKPEGFLKNELINSLRHFVLNQIY